MTGPETGPEAGPEAGPAQRPALRVISGDPTAEEVAALVAVIGIRRRPRPAGPATQSGWDDRVPSLRRTLPRGPGAWADSGRRD